MDTRERNDILEDLPNLEKNLKVEYSDKLD